MEAIIALAARGAVSAHVHAALPMEEFRAALSLIERREAQGKVLLRLAGEGAS
jgi:NADPH:quinone reductase-like Zn-dependent oxidoreductase